jgi:dienelactone hydrolase
MPYAVFGSNTHKERIIQWAKDLRRSVDYLGTRSDLDTNRFAYDGYSWGGYLAPVMLAVEPRFHAAVVYVGGFVRTRIQPEADPVAFAPRVSTPVLLLSGKYDDVDPLEASARPMFQLLGTRAGEKRHVVSEGGHFVPRPQLIRETLAWFDRYLGPVGAPLVRR